MKAREFDFIVLGGGVVGLTIAYELLKQKMGSVAILEKESHLGVHASGKNSGVIHAGIYYPKGSLKSHHCIHGGHLLKQFIADNHLPIETSGKVIVSSTREKLSTLENLALRAADCGIPLTRLSPKELAKIEPEATTVDFALHSPQTAVIDPLSILHCLQQKITDLGGTVLFNCRYNSCSPNSTTLFTSTGSFKFKTFINTAGMYADRVATDFSIGREYSILPIKGIYWKLSKKWGSKIRGSIYPTPDVDLPFLGIHFTRSVSGEVFVGPTAIPALGRENYRWLQDISSNEAVPIIYSLFKLLQENHQGFQNMVKNEILKYLPPLFLQEAKLLVPGLKSSDLKGIYKVGLRAQLYNRELKHLEMDFIVKQKSTSIHILNAVSPGFTSSFSIAHDIINRVRHPSLKNS